MQAIACIVFAVAIVAFRWLVLLAAGAVAGLATARRAVWPASAGLSVAVTDLGTQTPCRGADDRQEANSSSRRSAMTAAVASMRWPNSASAVASLDEEVEIAVPCLSCSMNRCAALVQPDDVGAFSARLLAA